MKRILAALLCLSLLLVLCPATAAQDQQHDYSTTANSGIRHEVCTTLAGTRVNDYYTGDYTYDKLSALSGTQLLAALRTLMTSTHKKQSTYQDCRDMAVKTDCENGDGTSVSLIYTSYSATWNDWCNNRSGGWNREHVWPQSLGGFKTTGAGGDLHHVRPSDQSVNSKRGNRLYGEVDGGSASKGAAYTGSASGGHYNSTYFEPLDNVKGDVARICLYVYVRYGSEYPLCRDIYNVFQDVDVLLSWCALDPVDTWEMGRNEVVAAYQGNRNVFIDYPELAWLLFDEDIPDGLTTPSGSGTVQQPGCPHSHTEIRDNRDATCGEDGYSGDSYCMDCGKLVRQGSPIQATGRHAYGDWVITVQATLDAPGEKERVCADCGKVQTQVIPQMEPPVVPSTGPTEPETKPTESATTPTTVPSAPPSTEKPAAPDEPEPAQADFGWLIWLALGIAILAAAATVARKRKK